MSKISANEWKRSLTKILEELTKEQFAVMLEYLEKIPKSKKNIRNRGQMAQVIIEHYGEEKSITVMRDIMEEIPRKDEAVQKVLRPFVEKLEEKEKAKKRNRTDPEDQQDSPAGKKKKINGTQSKPQKKKPRSSAGFEKNNIISDSDSSDEEGEVDDPESPQSEKNIQIPLWRISIKGLIDGGDTNEKRVGGKVVQKSGLRTYKTKGKKKFFFYMGVADETDCIKVMVYGKENFQKFQEGFSYNFRNVLVENFREHVMKVTCNSTFSKTKELQVSKTLELQAQMLIYSHSPVHTIDTIQSLDEKTAVSVEGTVTEIKPVKQVKVAGKRAKENITKFHLKDETGSIWITLWRKDAEQLKGKSVGDFVRVINTKTNWFNETMSLNSTDFTRIIKIQEADVQNVTIEIVGSIEHNQKESKLDVQINEQMETFIVASPLLAKVLGLKLKDDFEDKLLEKMPISAEAEIKGNKIIQLEVAKEM